MRSSPTIAPSRDQIGIDDWVAIPVSGLTGDNVAGRGEAMDWYEGPTLLEHLETVPIDSAADEAKPFRMPVQWVNRPDQHFRGFAGQIASGRVAPGDEVRILPSGRIGRIDTDRDDGRRSGRSGRRASRSR